MHYPSDVLAGAALGFGLGMLVPGLGEAPTEERLFELAVDANERAQATSHAPGNGGAGAARSTTSPRPADSLRNGVKIGIVGLPNAGKSTLFNALTRAGAETGDYAFTTIDPNVAVVRSPTSASTRSPRRCGSSEVVHETIEFHDIAGLVPGAAQGEGLGNKFLAAIRETDAICHVVRCHHSGGVPHPEGRIDPLDDIELIETELLAADLEQAERRLERVVKQARSGDKEASPSRPGSSRWSRRSAPARRFARSRPPTPPGTRRGACSR